MIIIKVNNKLKYSEINLSMFGLQLAYFFILKITVMFEDQRNKITTLFIHDVQDSLHLVIIIKTLYMLHVKCQFLPNKQIYFMPLFSLNSAFIAILVNLVSHLPSLINLIKSEPIFENGHLNSLILSLAILSGEQLKIPF